MSLQTEDRREVLFCVYKKVTLNVYYLRFSYYSSTPVLTSGERSDVVISVSDGDGDGGGGCAARGHSSHVLSFDHHHILTFGLPVQSAYLAADHTCRETVSETDRQRGGYLLGQR